MMRMSSDRPTPATLSMGYLERFDNLFKGIVEANRLLSEMRFSVVSWTESNNIGHYVRTIIPKADNVMGFDVSASACHEEALFAAILATTFGPANNVVSYHTITLIGKTFHPQPLRHECTLGSIVKIVERRLPL